MRNRSREAWDPTQVNKEPVGIIALDVPMAIDPGVIEPALQDRSVGLPTPVSVRPSETEPAGNFDISVGFFEASAVFVDAPVPWHELDRACDAAWWWPDAGEKMRSHSAYAVVKMKAGRGDVLSKTLVLTKLVAAIAESVEGLGIYWRTGWVVQSTRDFVELSKTTSPETPPLNLWVLFDYHRVSETHWQAYTIGMESLDCLEIEIAPVPLEPDDLLDLAYWVASEALVGDDTIESGDWFEGPAGKRLLVSFANSIWARPGTVMRLELE